MQPAYDIPPVIASQQRAPMTPVLAGERIETLDVLRGVALFGILIVNLAPFSWPYEYLHWEREFRGSRVDAVVDWFICFLAEGKFYPLFSFLFGLGAAIQMERATCRAEPFAGRYCRRMFVLLAFGIAHALLLWEGDILVSYAFCGLLLLPFQKRQPRTILIWGIVCLLIPALLVILGWALLAGVALIPEIGTAIRRGFGEYFGTYEQQRSSVEETIRIVASGSYATLFFRRLSDLLYVWPATILLAPGFLGLFLLGLYAGKQRIFQSMAGNTRLLRRVLVWGMIIGLPLNLLHPILLNSGGLADPPFLWLLSYGLATLGGPVQSLAYMAGLTLLLYRQPGKHWLRAIGTTGRMALSNYLLQSLICTTIFYGYGFGFFGTVGPAVRIVLAVVIFATQIGFSAWWLSRFQFGPMEWLWRTLTYGTHPPMRR